MHITVNGKERVVESGCSITALLELLNLKAEQVAVEHNRNIVLRPAFDTTTLQEGDCIEIVNFVGGG
ncbi:MAG: sulfur carrier protein ThiS [Geobacteraceae bacterium]|nr:sulfur carrier protein ThiS [Geobacteraceae bacterium]